MRPLRLAAVAVLLVVLAGCPAEDDPPPEPGATAAVVDGEEIPSSAVERRLDELQQAEAVEDGAATTRSRILSQLIVAHVTETGAREMGVDVEDEEIDELRAELVDAVGGDEELERFMAQAGVSPERLDEELRSLALLHQVGEMLAGEAPAAGATDDDHEAAVQEAARRWLNDRLDAADIEVDRAYGEWDADRRRVVPPEGERA